MPPYQRRRRWNYYKNNYRRRRYRRRNWWRRPRRTFQRRRHTRVRRKKFYFKRKKLKKLRLLQFQPAKIKKCRIKGYLQLFGAGHGRFFNNFTMYKESILPPHEPGGGGWGLQQFTLSNLYVQNEYLMNWWTKSNRGLNLCRLIKIKLTLYRQQNIDWIFTYEMEQPYNITKYYYQSLHPMRLLNYNKRIIVPAMTTMPHMKKAYKKITLNPPKEMMNKWYFQQHIANYPLLQFTAVACSLQSMFMDRNAINSNCTLYSLNTAFFQNPVFNFPNEALYPNGYVPKDGTFLYGIQRPAHVWSETPVNAVTYLGNVTIMDPGDPIGTMTSETYTYTHWGNPFYYSYLNGDMPMFITNITPSNMITNWGTKKVGEITPKVTWKHEPLIHECRYNPNYDRGDGNVAFWMPNNVPTKNKWEPMSDPIYTIENFPLWILLYGWEDFTKKLAEIRSLDDNYMLVVRSKYLDTKLSNFVFLSYSYVHGQGPYEVPGDEVLLSDRGHWFPKWRFQAEAINDLLKTGPGTCKAENQKSISAFLKYNFFFKWGGNPADMENVYDPTSQPTYPTPNNLEITNEIINPTSSISNQLYQWDIRRDFLTQTATKRITEYQTYEPYVFTDGTKATATDIPSQIYPKAQEETTEEEKESSLQQQLLRQRNINEQLQLRLLQLKKYMDNL